MHLASEDEIEHAADERNSHNDNDPGNFKGGVILPGEDVQHHQNADDIKDNADPIAHGADLDQKKQQQKKLDKNQHADDEQSAGEDLEQSLLWERRVGTWLGWIWAFRKNTFFLSMDF